jgi:hypothetical protein
LALYRNQSSPTDFPEEGDLGGIDNLAGPAVDQAVDDPADKSANSTTARPMSTPPKSAFPENRSFIGVPPSHVNSCRREQTLHIGLLVRDIEAHALQHGATATRAFEKVCMGQSEKGDGCRVKARAVPG